MSFQIRDLLVPRPWFAWARLFYSRGPGCGGWYFEPRHGWVAGVDRWRGLGMAPVRISITVNQNVAAQFLCQTFMHFTIRIEILGKFWVNLLYHIVLYINLVHQHRDSKSFWLIWIFFFKPRLLGSRSQNTGPSRWGWHFQTPAPVPKVGVEKMLGLNHWP